MSRNGFFQGKQYLAPAVGADVQGLIIIFILSCKSKEQRKNNNAHCSAAAIFTLDVKYNNERLPPALKPKQWPVSF